MGDIILKQGGGGLLDIWRNIYLIELLKNSSKMFKMSLGGLSQER